MLLTCIAPALGALLMALLARRYKLVHDQHAQHGQAIARRRERQQSCTHYPSGATR